MDVGARVTAGGALAKRSVAGLRVLVVVNRGSGKVRAMGEEAVRQTIAQGLPGAEIALLKGSEISSRVDRALAEKSHDIIIAGGGDGSVASIAGKLAGRDVALGVLPLGTMNMVAKAARIDLDLAGAARQLAGGTIAAVDIGRVNGEVFLHHVSFGLQPRMVRVREKIGYRSRLTKMFSGAVALTAVLSRPRPVKMIGSFDGKYSRLRAPMLAVSNNISTSARPGVPARLDGGELGVYALRATHWMQYVRLAFAALRGRWKEDELVEVSTAHRVRLTPFKKRQRAKMLASVDGELRYFKAPINIEIQPLAINLVMPGP